MIPLISSVPPQHFFAVAAAGTSAARQKAYDTFSKVSTDLLHANLSQKDLNSKMNKACLDCWLDTSKHLMEEGESKQYLTSGEWPPNLNMPWDDLVDLFETEEVRQKIRGVQQNFERQWNEVAKTKEWQVVPWDTYRENIPIPGAVDFMQKIYSKFTIPALNVEFVEYFEKFFDAYKYQLDQEVAASEKEVIAAQAEWMEYHQGRKKRLNQTVAEFLEDHPDILAEVKDEIAREEWFSEPKVAK